MSRIKSGHDWRVVAEVNAIGKQVASEQSEQATCMYILYAHDLPHLILITKPKQLCDGNLLYLCILIFTTEMGTIRLQLLIFGMLWVMCWNEQKAYGRGII